MTENTLFVGLDVHKKTVAVAIGESTSGAEVRFYGTIENTPEALRGLCRKLAKSGQQLHYCYEVGPCGYGVRRRLRGHFGITAERPSGGGWMAGRDVIPSRYSKPCWKPTPHVDPDHPRAA
jgi:hypothetical protein